MTDGSSPKISCSYISSSVLQTHFLNYNMQLKPEVHIHKKAHTFFFSMTKISLFLVI